MPFSVILIVLFAALLHATWNALIRSSGSRLWSSTVLCIAMGLFALCFVPFRPVPPRDSWIYIVASAALHVVYNLMLVRSYQRGELSVAYPIARGTSPVLVTTGAALFAGERIGAPTLFGLLLISGGIFAVGLDRRALGDGAWTRTLPDALGTGASIAAYSVVDGIGARAAGDSIGYAAWMFVLTALMMLPTYWLLEKRLTLGGSKRELLKAGFGGMSAALAYGIVIWAMKQGAMGPVSSLRETSVVFAALIGRLFLSEPASARKVLGCSIITTGTVLIGFSGALAK
ncbi:DMT family transporter [Burkholderia oklahomensis]|uniref:EamA-like transporter family protein n=1 Tax=Burkholderia oklahomensis TaxID=342113 RepID=A0AAI8BAH8_9BURK|nr:DMT family transporter [Burkholderia oklahomensis]AIO68541.1 eamA-like transporter family protein [Burkholderia oklahomensis]AJX33870.1 eamA-like transporter family protein [Burkholderia oklahomensis C6786]AOI39127.1 multidrug DMT transporter permease [Burkholderia oklahomensis EO147]AOI48815.1 multidrug DMT transporter permease [Burkholderia oklahomensis C6786]KUY50582.1 multidrug DMT transporter permease [Burkholderia oklahomensis C6786]